jgi:hypothetical protein
MRRRSPIPCGTIFASTGPGREGLEIDARSNGEAMYPRNIDAPQSVTLSRLLSRQHEDYLDWLENKDRPSLDWWAPVRFLLGVAGAAVLMFALAHLL